MKKSIVYVLVIMLLSNISCFSIFAQEAASQLAIGSRISPDAFNEKPITYDAIKKEFIAYYGTDKMNWPQFILTGERLIKNYEDYKSKNERRIGFSYYVNTVLEPDLNNNASFSHRFNSATRNFYPFMSSYELFLINKDTPTSDEKFNGFIDGWEKDGALAIMLYIHAQDCPLSNSNVLFEEIFPIINHLYEQKNINDLTKVIDSILEYTNKMLDNYEFIKADVLRGSLQRFVGDFAFQVLDEDLMDKTKSEQYRKSFYKPYDRIAQIKADLFHKFKGTFNQKMGKYVAHLQDKVVYHKPPHASLTAGRLEINKIDDNYRCQFFLNPSFPEQYKKLDENGLSVEKNNLREWDALFNVFLVKRDDANAKLGEIYKNATLYNRKGNLSFYLNEENKGTWDGIARNLFVVDEVRMKDPFFCFMLPRLTQCIIGGIYNDISDFAKLNIPISSEFRNKVQNASISAFIDAVEEVLGEEKTIPEIYGLDFKKFIPRKQALKIVATPNEIKPDGESTAEISVVLYDYIPGDNSSSNPLKGKTLEFQIESVEGIKPGEISASSAITDDNGKATFTYTAPGNELLQMLPAFKRLSSTIKIRCEEYRIEDLAYINFKSDDGKIWVTPSPGIISDQGFVPPHKDYPATINVHLEGTTEPNAEITFSIKEDDPVGMLRSPDGKEGKQIAVKTDGEGNAHVQYFYAASTPPLKRITETIEARTKNMAIPLIASVSTAFNIVLENAVSGYEGKGQLNAGEEVPLKITVKDEWNPELNLEEMLTYWGTDEGSGDKKLHVKLEIKKQGLVPSSMLDLLGEQNYPEPLYEELLVPKSFDGVKNLLYIPEYSLKKKGFPVVKPNFSGNNNYEINVSLVDEKGKPVFESAHPRAIAYVSVPTGLAADAFSIWFATNPLGPHTEEARFFRMLLGTVTFGEYGGFGSVISLADAAFAINKGDSEALANIMLSEIKNQVLSDAADKTGLTAERIKIYNNMAIADQYLSFALTAESDRGLIAQMESKILSGIANVGFGEPTQMVVLKGDGSQKLFIEPEQSPESDVSKTLKSAFKIKISGLDKNTNDLLKKVGEKIKGKGKEIPSVEGKYTYDDNLKTVSLKNGNVIIYVVPSGLKVVSENASDMKIY